MKKNNIRLFTLLSFTMLLLTGSVWSCAVKNPTKTETLRIMSFNVRYNNPNDNENAWVNRREACIKMFKDTKPDIFGIQEGLRDQVHYIDSLLPDYTWFGVGRDSTENNNEHCAIFYNSNDFNLLEQHTIWLSQTPEKLSKGWDAKYPRIATYGIFEAKKFKKNIVVINTHFDHKGLIAQENSSKLIVELVQKLQHDSLPIFVIGDLNAEYANKVLLPITTQLEYAQQQALITDDFSTINGWGKSEEKIIDYIFYKNATPTNYETIQKNYGVNYISDHYPILTDFEL